MVLTFNPSERAYVSDLNNLALLMKNAVRSGCLVTEDAPLGMSVKVATGTVFFGISNINVVPQTVSIAAAHPSFDRIDLIVVNSAGTASAITGTASTEPHTPTYNPLIYVVLARVYIQDSVTQIVNADITDLRVLNEFGYGAAGVATYLHNQSGASATWSVAHNLGDLQPGVLCFDSGGNPIEPESITVSDSNNLIVTFGSAITGKAKILGGQASPGGGGGEANTASNLGVTTYGVYKQKIGVDLQFKSLTASSSKITLTANANDVGINIAEGNIVHQNLSGAGTNAHSTIDSHIASTSNPHSVTATQVGKDTAQWNANKLQGRNVSAAAPANTNVLTWNDGASQWEPQAGGGGGGGYYCHIQAAPSSTWNVNHALNQKYAIVQVYDGTDNMVIPATVVLVDANNLTITFGSPLAGRAVVLI